MQLSTHSTSTDGTVVSTYDCFEFDDQGDAVPIMEAGCILATEIEDALYIVDADRLHRYNTFEECTRCDDKTGYVAITF